MIGEGVLRAWSDATAGVVGIPRGCDGFFRGGNLGWKDANLLKSPCGGSGARWCLLCAAVPDYRDVGGCRWAMVFMLAMLIWDGNRLCSALLCSLSSLSFGGHRVFDLVLHPPYPFHP